MYLVIREIQSSGAKDSIIQLAIGGYGQASKAEDDNNCSYPKPKRPHVLGQLHLNRHHLQLCYIKQCISPFAALYGVIVEWFTLVLAKVSLQTL